MFGHFGLLHWCFHLCVLPIILFSFPFVCTFGKLYFEKTFDVLADVDFFITYFTDVYEELSEELSSEDEDELSSSLYSY